MALLYPIGLLALSGLIIPVLIHLWSVKKGKTLKIGSIALLGENATASSRSLQLTDLLLFFLRCLILILTALLLAQPYFIKTELSTSPSGWILMEKSQFSKAYESNRPTIDSLLNLGYELHDFNIGFKQFALKDSLTVDSSQGSLSYRALVSQLNKEIPKGYTAYVYADRRLRNFEGALEQPNFRLFWKELTTNDTLKTWSSTLLGKVYQAKSSPLLTKYESSPQELPKIKVLVYSPSTTDVRYVKAALRAIADFTKRPIEVNNYNVQVAQEANIIFWLSDEPLTNRIAVNTTIFAYRKGKVISINSNLQLTSGADDNIALHKRVEADSLSGTSIWTDGYGDPLLVEDSKANVPHFYFYSRFNPQWTDLVWNEQLVSALLPIILNSRNSTDFGFEDHPDDQRLLTQQPFLQSKIGLSGASVSKIQQSLELTIWMIIAVLLLVERILSLRKKTNLAYVRR